MTIRQLEHKNTILSKNSMLITIICDGIRTPENVGMIFRVAEALGVSQILFSKKSPGIENTKVKKTARNTTNYISSKWLEDLGQEVNQLKAEGYTIIGLELTNKSIPLSNYDFRSKEKIAIVIGSERNGISQEILNETDDCVMIPMYGKNSSMNVVNALSIVLYEITKT